MTSAVPTPDEVGGRLLPLDRRNAAQQIADRVVTAIALGEFVEGQRLPPERELARMLGTARPTIREALQRLESQGFVAVHRGRNGGAVVQPFDWPAARDAVRQTLLPTWAEFEVLFDFRTAHGAGGNPASSRRRVLSLRWVGDDARYAERPGRTSPPFPGHGMLAGQRLREDWFPVVWNVRAQPALPDAGQDRTARSNS